MAPSLGPTFAPGFSLRVARLPSVVVARRSGAPGLRRLPSSSFPFLSTLASTPPGTDFLRHLITRLPSSEPVLKTALPETASLLHATPPFAPAANPNPPNRQKPGPTGLPSPVLSRWAARDTKHREIKPLAGEIARIRPIGSTSNATAPPSKHNGFFHIDPVPDTQCPVLDSRTWPASRPPHQPNARSPFGISHKTG